MLVDVEEVFVCEFCEYLIWVVVVVFLDGFDLVLLLIWSVVDLCDVFFELWL